MKTGRNKTSSKPPNDRERKRAEEEEKALADEFLASTTGRNVHRATDMCLAADAEERRALASDDRIRARTGDRFDFEVGRRVLTTPDVPPCDGCKRPFSGTMQCSRCEAVFYCGRDCQVSHWTSAPGGHKAECKLLKERNEVTARQVLGDFMEYRGQWRDLDVTGVYNAAVNQGLHDKIREVMELDAAEFVNRLRRGPTLVSYTQLVMSTLFRGHRAEGRPDARSPAFTCVDGPRVKKYVTSHPDALDAWLHASVQLVRAVTDPRAPPRDPGLYRTAMYMAESVWNGWMFVFMNSTSARAVLRPIPSSAPAAGAGAIEEGADQRRRRGIAHATRIVKLFREAVRLVASVPNNPRFNFDLFAELLPYVYQVAAMVHVRAEEFRIGIDVKELLNLEDRMKPAFQHLFIPMVTRIIQEGRALNDQEMNAGLARASRVLGSD